MEKFANAALYNVDLEGKDCGEFGGQHPTLVFRTKMEKEMYIAIPFTTYTPERWLKLKSFMCCRVKSTNSIARIDKIEIITVNKITNRWRENGKLLIPSKEDLQTVIDKVMAYCLTSFNTGLRSYVSLNDEYETLSREFDDIIIKENILKKSFMSLDFTNQNYIILIFGCCHVRNISIHELYDLLNSAFSRGKYQITFPHNNVSIKISLTDKKALTLMQKHDSIKASEG